MAPEYAYHGEFSPKSDVFSFGVLILEIIRGEKNIDFCNNNGERDVDLLNFVSIFYTWLKILEKKYFYFVNYKLRNNLDVTHSNNKKKN